ncbi:hypothetical protein OH77DRAFT_126106 [Trametes cingulata]|nr:hypothetical protein OH77DRAFT_126106 [Trametes cingulata]
MIPVSPPGKYHHIGPAHRYPRPETSGQTKRLTDEAVVTLEGRSRENVIRTRAMGELQKRHAQEVQQKASDFQFRTVEKTSTFSDQRGKQHHASAGCKTPWKWIELAFERPRAQCSSRHCRPNATIVLATTHSPAPPVCADGEPPREARSACLLSRGPGCPGAPEPSAGSIAALVVGKCATARMYEREEVDGVVDRLGSCRNIMSVRCRSALCSGRL